MGWFEDQLKERYENENATFVASLDSIVNAVIGERLQQALENREVAESAIEEILKYFHHPMNRDEFPDDINTLDDQIAFYMQPYGIARRRVTLDKGWYKHAIGAMIGTLKEDGSAVALIPNGFGGYSFYDIKSGKKLRLNKKTEQMLDEEAICFFEPFPLRSLTIKDLFIFMAKQLNGFDLLIYFGLLGISTLLGMLSPKFTQWLFGNVLESGSPSILFALATFMICFSAGRIVFEVYRTLMTSRINTKWSIAVEAAVMNRMLSLPTTFFGKYSTGDLSTRSAQFRSLCMTLANTVTNTGFTALFSLAYIGQIFLFAPVLAVPSIFIILITVLVSTMSVFSQMKVTEKKLKISAELSNISYTTISGIQKIKLAGAEKRMFSRWANIFSKEAQLTYNPPVLLKYNSLIITAITMTGTVILYYLAVKSNVSIANYYAFTSSYGMVSGAFTSLASIITTVAMIKPTIEMAKPIMEAEPEQTDGKKRIKTNNGAIELSHVSFRYSDDMPNVINQLSLKIKAKEYVAIVGSTGCGKSTLVRLLLGFEKPQKGSILFDGTDISQINLQSLRKNIGVVLQNGQLFNGDIFSNIVIAAPQSTLDDAWEAAKLACIDEDIKAMPMGMFTMISEGQGGISGGQRQRLMIARAVVSKPKLLIFDEATSALDNITQKKVSEAIDGLDCTRIVIAHRLSTIQHADRIIYMEAGQIAEEGTYDELIAKNGKFATLVERQRLETKD